MDSRLIVVVVVYNKNISSNISLDYFNSIKGYRNIEILVLDNSTESSIVHTNKKVAEECGYVYFCNDMNLGLSKCYNMAIDYASKYDDYWMFLADDDTYFSPEYINNVFSAISDESNNIITGIIKTGSDLFSPVKERTFFSRDLEFINEPGLYRNIYAVNSGLTIRKKVLDLTNGFDERLFLDLVDYNFMNVLIRKGLNTILVVSGDISQFFSGNICSSYKSQKHRIKIFEKDMRTFCRLNNINSLYGEIMILKRKMNVFRKSIFRHN